MRRKAGSTEEEKETEQLEEKQEVTPRISWSQLKNWLTCARYHQAVSITNEIDYPENKWIVIGSIVHDVFEVILTEILCDLPKEWIQEDTEYLLGESFYRKQDEISDDIDQEFISEYLSDILPVLEKVPSILSEKFPGGQMRGIEQPVYCKFDSLERFRREFIIRGHIDCIIERDGKIYIIDWKTSKRGWGEFHFNSLKIVGQLELYRYLLDKKQLFPYKDIVPLYGIINRKQQELDFYRPSLDVEKVLKKVDNMLYSAFEEEIYFPSKTFCQPFCKCEEEELLYD